MNGVEMRECLFKNTGWHIVCMEGYPVQRYRLRCFENMGRIFVETGEKLERSWSVSKLIDNWKMIWYNTVKYYTHPKGYNRISL